MLAMATAIASFGARSKPMKAVSKAVKSLGGGDAAISTLMVAYEAQFLNILAGYEDSGNLNQRVRLPKAAKLNFKDSKSIKKVLKHLYKRSKEIKILNKSVVNADRIAINKNIRAYKKSIKLLATLNKYLFEKMKIDYILLTNINGTKKDYESGKTLKLSQALMNVHTGRVRYFGESSITKDSLATPFPIQVGIASNSIFENLEDEIIPE